LVSPNRLVAAARLKKSTAMPRADGASVHSDTRNARWNFMEVGGVECDLFGIVESQFQYQD
jgi:hypothetical protein